MRFTIIAALMATQTDALTLQQSSSQSLLRKGMTTNDWVNGKFKFVEWKQCKKSIKKIKGEKKDAKLARLHACVDPMIDAVIKAKNEEVKTATGNDKQDVINTIVAYQCRKDCKASTGAQTNFKGTATKNRDVCMNDCVKKGVADWAAKDEESEEEPEPTPVPSEESEEEPEPTPLPEPTEESEESDEEPTEPYDDTTRDGVNSKDTNAWGQTVLEKVNALRTEAGVAPLVWSQKIADITKPHNRQCTLNKRKSAADQAARLLAAGGDAVEIMGNNWNNGYAWKPAGSLEKLFADWSTNANYKALMTDPKYTKAGLSVYNSSGCQFMSTLILTN